MNHIAHSSLASPHPAPTICHPERSLADSEATRRTASKDPYNLHAVRGDARNFRTVVRFFDDHDTELIPTFSQADAPLNCHFQTRSGERMQPTAQAVGSGGKCTSSGGAKETPPYLRTAVTFCVGTAHA